MNVSDSSIALNLLTSVSPEGPNFAELDFHYCIDEATQLIS